MIVVADASVLVAELLRRRGGELLADPNLRVVVAEHQWAETQHELRRRLVAMIEQQKLTNARAHALGEAVGSLVEARVIDVLPIEAYRHLESIACRRVPRDPNDWPTVALALALQTGILTGDRDFLGCGCPTWTVETLRDELAAE